MVSIAKALGRVKDDLRNLLPASVILSACRAVGQAFRDGLLTPVNTVYVFLLQVLHGNRRPSRRASSRIGSVSWMRCDGCAWR